MSLREKWLQTVKEKNSLLCIGLDPAEAKQRETGVLPLGGDKLTWCLNLVKQVSPYAAAIKINRNYVKDFGRSQLKELNNLIHAEGMLSIDDAKLADIGDSNAAGFYHAAVEGFDCVTYCPFPGNTHEAVKAAHSYGIGIITLVIMSNPEFQIVKSSTVAAEKAYRYFAKSAAAAGSDGIVLGAPSSQNAITVEEIAETAALIGSRLVLVPGLGAQAGDTATIIKIFGNYTMVNAGRSVIYDRDPAGRAKELRDQTNRLRP